MLEVDHVTKVYPASRPSGPARGQPRRRPGRAGRDRRAVGVGQDHPDATDGDPRPAHQRPGADHRAATSPPWPTTSVAYLRATRIGFVFQQFFLAEHSTVLDNVADGLLYAGIPIKQRRQRALDTLDLVGLAERPHVRPTQLSGGQRQRVAIARALVGQPAIVLADEPTGNLDQATGQSILALIDELHQAGSTIVVITHDRVIAERMPRTVGILDGRIVADTGPAADTGSRLRPLRLPGSAPHPRRRRTGAPVDQEQPCRRRHPEPEAATALRSDPALHGRTAHAQATGRAVRSRYRNRRGRHRRRSRPVLLVPGRPARTRSTSSAPTFSLSATARTSPAALRSCP